jgi:hypothetical protein
MRLRMYPLFEVGGEGRVTVNPVGYQSAFGHPRRDTRDPEMRNGDYFNARLYTVASSMLTRERSGRTRQQTTVITAATTM